MSIFSGHVVGDEKVVASMAALGPDARRRLVAAIYREGYKLQALVKLKLSGEVLNRRSGRLRNSINLKVTEGETKITGAVGTNVIYAAAHEYGFHGEVSVKAHLRRNKEQMKRRLKGKAQGPQEKGLTTVKAHLMKMNLPEKSFLRSALREMTDEILLAMSAAGRPGGE